MTPGDASVDPHVHCNRCSRSFSPKDSHIHRAGNGHICSDCQADSLKRFDLDDAFVEATPGFHPEVAITSDVAAARSLPR